MRPAAFFDSSPTGTVADKKKPRVRSDPEQFHKCVDQARMILLTVESPDVRQHKSVLRQPQIGADGVGNSRREPVIIGIDGVL
jgi:hypothetical protein